MPFAIDSLFRDTPNLVVPGVGEFSVRRLIQADFSTLLECERSHHLHPWSANNLQDSLDHHQCIGLWREAELLGYAVMSFAAGEAELLLFVLDQRWRQKGVASAFLRLLMGLAKGGAEAIFLEVRESNRSAIQLYEACGFNEVGVRPNYYPLSKGRENALIFAAELT